MAKAAAKNLKLEQINMVFAYLYGHLNKNKTIYIKLALKYLTNDENCIALLNLVFYNLKQRAKV